MQRAVEKAAGDERVFIAGPRVALADQAGRGGAMRTVTGPLNRMAQFNIRWLTEDYGIMFQTLRSTTIRKSTLLLRIYRLVYS
jgi:hypothetical protein